MKRLYKVRNYVCVVMLLLFFCTANAQLSASIKGYIKDANTGASIPGAVVSVDSLAGGTFTDSAGYFLLNNLSLGYHTVTVSMLGYEKYVEPGIYVSTGRENILEILMTPSDNILEDVVVRSAVSTTEDLSVVKLQPLKQGERLAGGFNDIGRMLLSYAGVQTILDGSNQLVVRGTGPLGFGWRINGVPMGDPNHFSSTAQGGGAVGILSTYVLDKADFYSGALPASMGNALSGVMDMRLRNGDHEKTHLNLRLGMLGLDAMLEGPLSKKKKASYLINYRFSTITIIEKMGINIHGTEFTDGEISTNFQDMAIAVNVPVTDKFSMQPFFIMGKSRALNGFSERNSRREDNYYLLAMGGIKFRHVINEKWKWKGTFATDYVNFKLDVAHKPYQNFFRNFRDRGFDDLVEDASTVSHKLCTEMEFRPTQKHALSAGYLLHIFDFNYTQNNYSWAGTDFDGDELADSIFIDDTSNAGSGSVHSLYYEAFISWQYRISNRVTVETGLQFNQVVFNRHSNIEPRMRFTWRPRVSHKLSVAVGLQSRMLPYSNYVARQPWNEDPQPNYYLDLQKAVHTGVGYSWQFAPDFIFKAEIYYQHLYSIPVETPGAQDYDVYYSSLNDRYPWYWKKLVSEGKGRNYGIELTLEKSFSRLYYFIANASVYSSRYKTLGTGWIPTTYDGRFICNVSGGKDFVVGKKGGNLISLNAKLYWAGGSRYREILQDENGQYYGSAGFTGKVKDYFRTDLKVAYKRNKKRASWEMSGEVQNLTNRLNELNRNFNRDRKDYDISYHIGILPVLRFSLEI